MHALDASSLVAAQATGSPIIQHAHDVLEVLALILDVRLLSRD